MLIEIEPGVLMAGPADVICILQVGNRFHAAFFEELPMPGPIQPIKELDFIRLKSKMHHTIGTDTLEGAKKHVEEMRKNIKVNDNNIADEPLVVDDPISVLVIENWVRRNEKVKLQ